LTASWRRPVFRAAWVRAGHRFQEFFPSTIGSGNDCREFFILILFFAIHFTFVANWHINANRGTIALFKYF